LFIPALKKIKSAAEKSFRKVRELKPEENLEEAGYVRKRQVHTQR
jgi:hypothetical protein